MKRMIINKRLNPGFSIKAFSVLLLMLIVSSYNLMALTLDEAAREALDNNFSIRIAQHDKAIAERNYSRGNAGFYPVFSLQGSNTFDLTQTRQEFVDGEEIDRDLAQSTGLNYGAVLEYPVFTGLDRYHHYRSLEHAMMAQQEQEKVMIESMMLELVRHFYDVRRLQELTEVTEQSIEISEERLRIAEQQYEAGGGSRVEFLQARADLNAEKSLLLQQENQLKQAKVRLNELLARDPGTEFEVQAELSFMEFPALEEQRQGVAAENPEIAMHEHQLKVAERQISRERSHRYPEVGVNLSYDFGRSTSEAGFISSSRSLGWHAGLTVRINLFDGFNTNRRIENARISHEISQLQLREQEQRALADLAEARVTFENALAQLELEQDNAEVVEENAEIALQQYEQGVIIAVELRETQKTLLESQARLRNVEFEAKVAEARLLKLTGNLNQALID